MRHRQPYRHPPHCKAPPQQHHQHTQCQIHDHGYQGLPPQHPNGPDEYMRLQLDNMPEEVIEHYKLADHTPTDGHDYCKIQKGMYCLPQVGVIAQQLLEERLKEHGYHQSMTTPGMWKHGIRPISFSLVVGDCWGKICEGGEHTTMLETVQKYYNCSCNWEGIKRYCRLTIKCDYKGWEVYLLMPGYVRKALTHFQHPPLSKRQDQPYPHNKPNYVAKTQN